MALAFSQLDRLGWKLLDHEVAQVHNAHNEHINMYGRHDIDLRDRATQRQTPACQRS